MASKAERDLLERVYTLESIIRGKDREIRDLKSGATYVSLQRQMAKDRRHHEAREKRLETTIKRERKAHERQVKGWMEAMEALCAERDTEAARRAGKLEARALKAERRVDELKDELTELKRDIAERDARIAELEGLVAKLEAQLRRDFENSSVPSSKQGLNRRRIPNTREPTGRRRGAQTGHPHHPRKRPEPDRVVDLGLPEEACEGELYLTGEVVRKSLVSARIVVDTTEYTADVRRSRLTGARVHAPFPEGLKDDVTYDASVKALCFMLTQQCGASLERARTFLKEATAGALDVSCGMIWNLSREFRAKTEPERARAVEALMGHPYMGADFTDANVSGSHAQVLILANANACQMYAKEHKGHAGVEDTPLQDYVGQVVSDHDLTFYAYGTSHQECMAHNLRYLTASIQTEPHLTWNAKMLCLIKEMLHWRGSIDWDDPPSEEEIRRTVEGFKRQYDEILDIADREYEAHPPGRYNREGYNLAKRLREYKESELAFLDHPGVPSDNSRCERLARVFKRRQHGAIAFRSMEGLEIAVDAISVIENLRNEGTDVFDAVTEIFER